LYHSAQLEHTVPDLQAQLDQLTLALRQWRETRDHAEPVEQRLAELTERCTEIVNRWAATSERHARAVSEVEARLQHWNAIESRLEQDSAQRVRELSEVIQREWDGLRRIHEEPVKQLRDQAVALGETCMAAASLAVRGFERTEARLAALEADLHGRLNQLSRDLQTALAPASAKPADVTPFPLDGVMRIHEELRGGTTETASSAPPEVPGARATAETAPTTPATVTPAVVTHTPAVVTHTPEVLPPVTANWRPLGFAVAAGALLLLAIAGFGLKSYIDSRMNEADARVTAAERTAEATADAASKQLEATRAETQRQIAEAQQAALQARIASAVTVASDVLRFNLVPTDSTLPTTAQVLWSRSSGLVLSASQLAPPPSGTTYQIWLLNNTVPIAAGTFVPDRQGRATVVLENPAQVPRPINGVMITLEPAAGSRAPSGTPVLIRQTS
jgi:hypothetical protein